MAGAPKTKENIENGSFSQVQDGDIEKQFETQLNISDSNTVQAVHETEHPVVDEISGNVTSKHARLESANADLRKIPRGVDQDRMFTQDIDGDTSLHTAIILKDEETSIRLINLAPTQAWHSSRNLLFQTPLHLAALTNQSNVLKHLIIAGADVTFRDKHGNTALHIACRSGFVRVVETLLTPAPNLMPQHLWDGVQYQQEPPNFGIHNYDGLTCLHLAAVNKHLHIIETLVKYDINLNMKDLKTGKTILHGSCERNDTELVSFLLRHRICDINARDYDNSTPFDVARARSNSVICEALAAAGAKYGQQSDSD